MSVTDQQTTLIDTVRAEVNDFLQAFFAEKALDAERIDPHYKELWSTVAHLSQSGGKRLRPYMMMLAYTSFGGRDMKAVVPIAAGQELLHLSMLVHDDIIDRDLVRYGIKNIQGYYEGRYAEYTENVSERSHYAASAAIMAGDLLLSGAYEVMISAPLPPRDILQAQKYLAGAVFSVVGGELLDTEAPLLPLESVNTEHIALYKTASYSFNGPLLSGASLAGADEQALEGLAIFGEALGVAYQLTDDLLGVFGDEVKTGKSTSSDISEAKRTLLLQETYRRCTTDDKIIIDQLVGNPELSNEQANIVREIMVRSGAKAAVESVIATCRQKSLEALDTIEMKDEARRAEFVSLVDRATKRSV